MRVAGSMAWAGRLGSEQDGTKKEIPTGWSDRLGLTHSSPVRASRPSPLPTLALPRRDAANRSIEQSSCRHIPEGTSAYPMSTAKFLKKVMTMLANIRVELREQREGKEMAISDLQTIPFQTRSIDELQRIDDTLKSPEDCLKMTMALACVGGSSINENARKILQKLMTNESITGKKGKLRFQNLKLFKVVLHAVVRTMRCTETTAETAMYVALKYAPDRIGGGGRKKADGELLS
ncbi:hypothetical protein KP79_PYT22414 [Mizuhopecten yessoensis]|uniref:DUF4806 domain-containing protein n=1 Tax=Mizuhopecten yessoensis TaxID=6573 RepID=A0A210QW96_MIZYE|nr:hypothetical protein KP79_PYT22414 [Mizuhopecten yessoensis]